MNNKIFAVLLPSVVLVGLGITYFLVGGKLPGIARIGEPLEMPTEVAVDQERFLANFQVWTVLSNFEGKLTVKKDDDGITRGVYDFSIQCTASGNSDSSIRYAWVVETYADGKLHDTMRYELSSSQINDASPEQPLVLQGKTGINVNRKPTYRFVSYMERIRQTPFARRQLVSGLIEPGGPPTSPTPVAIKPTMKHRAMLELSNPTFDINEGSGQDRFECDMKVVDDKLYLDFHPDNSDQYGFVINVVNGFGGTRQFWATGMLEEKEEKLRLSNDPLLVGNTDDKYLQRRPLTVYISRESHDLGNSLDSKGILNRQHVFSNLLTIE